MFALVLFVCYLDGGCDDLVLEVFASERQCLSAMSEQRIRRGGCYPAEEIIDRFWQPARQYSDL